MHPDISKCIRMHPGVSQCIPMHPHVPQLNANDATYAGMTNAASCVAMAMFITFLGIVLISRLVSGVKFQLSLNLKDNF